MKPSKTNTDPEVSTTKKYEYEDYYCLYSFMQKPVNSAYIEKLAQEMMSWAQTDEAFKVTQFWLSKGIRSKDFYRWCDKHQCLKEVYDAVKILLGNRREIGAIKKNFDSSTIRASMKLYDEDWKGIDSDQEGNKQTIVVVEKMPTSNLVPEKKGK